MKTKLLIGLLLISIVLLSGCNYGKILHEEINNNPFYNKSYYKEASKDCYEKGYEAIKYKDWIFKDNFRYYCTNLNKFASENRNITIEYMGVY